MNKKELLNKADELINKANELKELANEQNYILVPDEIEISVAYGKYLAIHNWNQKLYYAPWLWNWCVMSSEGDKSIKCKLTPCEYEDLEPWDLFYRSSNNDPDYKNINQYAIKLEDWSYQYCYDKDCLNRSGRWQYYWKVEPI